jgi:hypothetical protein
VTGTVVGGRLNAHSQRLCLTLTLKTKQCTSLN